MSHLQSVAILAEAAGSSRAAVAPDSLSNHKGPRGTVEGQNPLRLGSMHRDKPPSNWREMDLVLDLVSSRVSLSLRAAVKHLMLRLVQDIQDSYIGSRDCKETRTMIHICSFTIAQKATAKAGKQEMGEPRPQYPRNGGVKRPE